MLAAEGRQPRPRRGRQAVGARYERGEPRVRQSFGRRGDGRDRRVVTDDERVEAPIAVNVQDVLDPRVAMGRVVGQQVHPVNQTRRPRAADERILTERDELERLAGARPQSPAD